MLPSSGYFRTVDCPFYSNGLCERPYCHFRHESPSTPTAGNFVQKWNLPMALNEFGNDVVFSREDQLHHLEKIIQKVQEDVKRNEEELAGIHSTTSASEGQPAASKDPKKQQQVTYIPTPVVKPPVVGRHTNMPDTTCSRIPEYRPTPIAKLRKMQKGIVVESEPVPTEDVEYDPVTSYKTPEPTPKVKRKRTEEYDPTLVKCKPKYSMPLVEDSDEDVYVPKKIKVNTVDSSSNKANEGDDALQFSDDDGYVDGGAPNENHGSSENHDDKPEDMVTEDVKASRFDLVQNILMQSKQSIENLKSRAKDMADKAKPASTKPTDVNKSVVKDHRKPNATTSPKSSLPSDDRKDKRQSSSKEAKKDKSSKSSSSSSHGKDCAPSARDSESKPSKEGGKKDHKSAATAPSSSEKGKDPSCHKKSGSPVKSSSKDCHRAHKNHESPRHSSEKDKSTKNNRDKSSKSSAAHKTHKSEGKVREKLKVSSSSTAPKHGVSKHVSGSGSSSKSSKDEKSSSHKPTMATLKSSSSEKTKSNCSSEKSKLSAKKGSSDEGSVIRKKHHHHDKRKTASPKESDRSDSENFKVPDEPVWLAIRSNPPVKPSPKASSGSSNIESDSDDNDDNGCDGSVFDYSSIDLDDLDTDLDEHDTYEECLRIFNESNAIAPAQSEDDNPSLKKAQKVEKVNSEFEEVPMFGKKRVAYKASDQIKRPIQVSRISQVQLINSRLQKVQEVYSKHEAILKKQAPNPFANSTTSGAASTTKRRIAHVPNAALIAAAAAATRKTSVTNHSFAAANSASATAATAGHLTIATTVAKGEKRVAHVPNISNRPVILAEYGSKVPTAVRQRYLNLFVDECLKFYPEEEDAFERAVAEEKNVYDRSSNKTVYLNVAVNAIKRIRNEAESSHLAPTKPSTSKQAVSANSRPQPMKISHEYILAGPKAANFGYRLERNKIQKRDVEISGAKLYQLLKPYILSREQLEENGFPLAHPTEPGKAIILNTDNASKKNVSSDPLSRICDRCSKKFRVTPKGLYVVQEECVYHWGKAWKKKIAGSWETRYNCCQGDLESDGCCVAAGHVYEGSESNVLKGFVKTLPKTPPIDGNFGVYSLDCEMCYTTAGMELTRVTVINSNLKPVFESLVKPENPILDYNTRFSGITEEDLSRVRTTIRDVQAVLLSMINDKTILMGHSLESDFKALKLIHPTVVDTSVVFPHRRGPPLKRALKNLMGEYLNKIIQNSVDGHDSQEDAVACMELMLWKIREDLRRSGR